VIRFGLRKGRKKGKKVQMTQTVAGPKCVKSWNQKQTLKACLCCHIYCAHLETPWYSTVTSLYHGEETCQGPCHAKFVEITAGHQLPLTHRALTVPQYQILCVLNRLFLYSCSKPEHSSMGDHSCTTGNRSRKLCYDSWSFNHLGYSYPGTTPVVIKLTQGQLLL